MGEVAMTVPARYADDFRAALAHELGVEAGYVEKEREKFLEALTCKSGNADQLGADLRGAMKMLSRDAELLLQAGYEESGDVEISLEDDLGTVAYACETVARNIVGPQLVEALEVGPFDSKYVPKLRDLVDRLTWAIDSAAELNGSFERKAAA